jgi:hypothetical protein
MQIAFRFSRKGWLVLMQRFLRANRRCPCLKERGHLQPPTFYSGTGPSVTWTISSGRSHFPNAVFTFSGVTSDIRAPPVLARSGAGYE